MATIKNLGSQPLHIAGHKLVKNAEVEVSGLIPRSLRILEQRDVLQIEGDDGEGKLKIGAVTNPEPSGPAPKTDEQITTETENKIIAIMRSLPEGSFMGDGRPEVRVVNEKLAGAEMSNITAADRDRLWALASKE